MKKIALILSIVIILSSCIVITSAKNNIPVKAVFSETDDGDIKVMIYPQNPKKLISLFTIVEYDTSLYSLKSANACADEGTDGSLNENFPGMWVFGALADGTGCVGAFVSDSGVTRSGEVAACEFIIHPETSRKDLQDITIYVKEYITDDNDEENDINRKTPVNSEEPPIDVSEIFDYTIGETITITSIKTADGIIFVPEYIKGILVRSLDTDVPSDNTFVVFGRNVLKVGEMVFGSRNMVIAPVDSASVAAVKKAGGKYFSYRENIVADLNEPIFYTHQNLVKNGEALFETDTEYGVFPSHRIGGFWGTGTAFSLKNNDKNCEFLLCVMGDINGDSVCDVLDTMLCERSVNGLEELSHIQEKSTDFTKDGVVDVQDYVQIVNQSLDGDNLVFQGVRGDFNGDYAVDALDVFEFNNMLKKPDLMPEDKICMDLNNDGEIDFADIAVLEILAESFY